YPPPPTPPLFPYTTLFRSPRILPDPVVREGEDFLILLAAQAPRRGGSAIRPMHAIGRSIQVFFALRSLRGSPMHAMSTADQMFRSEEHTSELQSRSDVVCR